MVVFLCGEEFEDIMCGVYDAWMSRQGHSHVRLEFERSYTPELFCEYRRAEVSREKAEKVITAIKERISEDAYALLYEASLSREEDRADAIYRFLIYGFHFGSSVSDMLQIPAVYRIFEICRYLKNEAHYLKEFVRFSEVKGNILAGTIGPNNDVLILVARHFADRLSGENWILFDEKRNKAAVHRANQGWMIVQAEADEWKNIIKKVSGGDIYEDLWKCFFQSIAIKERTNPVCQRNHLPLRYRKYMTEFQKS